MLKLISRGVVAISITAYAFKKPLNGLCKNGQTSYENMKGRIPKHPYGLEVFVIIELRWKKIGRIGVVNTDIWVLVTLRTVFSPQIKVSFK
jgi:hypothetical protein